MYNISCPHIAEDGHYDARELFDQKHGYASWEVREPIELRLQEVFTRHSAPYFGKGFSLTDIWTEAAIKSCNICILRNASAKFTSDSFSAWLCQQARPSLYSSELELSIHKWIDFEEGL